VLTKKQVSKNYTHAECVSSLTIGKIMQLQHFHFCMDAPALDALDRRPFGQPLCTPLVLSAVFCSGLLTWSADNLCSLQWHIVQQRVRRVRVEYYARCVNTLRQNFGLQTWI